MLVLYYYAVHGLAFLFYLIFSRNFKKGLRYIKSKYSYLSRASKYQRVDNSNINKHGLLPVPLEATQRWEERDHRTWFSRSAHSQSPQELFSVRQQQAPEPTKERDTEIRQWRSPKQQLEQTSCGNNFRWSAEINPVLFYFTLNLVLKTRATLSTNQMQN